MKHDEAQHAVMKMLEELELTVPEAKVARMVEHVEWLLETNSTVNLTAIVEFEDALRLHVVDSLIALPELTEAPEGRVLDIGTGGGFPGIPLGLASDRHVVLLDSILKKAVVLRSYVDTAGLDATVTAERAEEHALMHAGAYSAVVARAVSSLPSLVELASPLLSPGGRLIALKGRLAVKELERGDEVGAIAGMARVGSRATMLPATGEERHIVVYERRGDVEVKLPRRAGRAQRKPLA